MNKRIELLAFTSYVEQQEKANHILSQWFIQSQLNNDVATTRTTQDTSKEELDRDEPLLKTRLLRSKPNNK